MKLSQLDGRLTSWWFQTTHKALYTWLIYSVLFFVASFFCFHPFISGKIGFIQYFNDGWLQMYPSIGYIGDFYRTIVENLFAGHGLQIPFYDFRFGLGDNAWMCLISFDEILFPLHMLLTTLTPLDHSEFLYVFIVLEQMYLAGAAMLFYCRYREFRNGGAIGAALIYVFSGFVFFQCARHYYFLIPMIFLPLLLVGIEQSIHNKKPYWLILSVFFALISSYYFFYMLTWVIVVYALIRFFQIHQQNRLHNFGHVFLRCARDYLIGVLLAGFVIMPVIMTFLQGRRSADYLIPSLWTYGENYNSTFFSTLFSVGGTALSLSLPPICFLALIVLFISRKHWGLKVGVLIGFMIALTPFWGYALNGFSYVTDRWPFIPIFIFSLMFACVYPRLVNLNNQEQKAIIVSTCIYSIALVLFSLLSNYQLTLYSLLGIVGIAIATLILCNFHSCSQKIPNQQSLKKCFTVLTLVVVGVSINGYFFNASQYKNYVGTFKEYGIAEPLSQTSTALAMQHVNDPSFYRVDATRGTAINMGIRFEDSYGVQEYWSLQNPAVTLEQIQLENAPGTRHAFSLNGMDQRAALTSLASVKYYATNEAGKAYAPYGFQLVSTVGDASNLNYIFENKYYLPLGYAYSDYILEEQYNSLNGLERQAALLQTIKLDAPIEGFKLHDDLSFSHTQLPAQMSLDGVTFENGIVNVAKKNATMTLQVNGIKDAEMYVRFSGLDINDSNLGYFDCKVTANSGITKQFTVFSNTQQMYCSRENYSVNMGYAKEAGAVTYVITWPSVGRFHLDNVAVYAQPMARYGEQISALQDGALQNVEIGVNKVTGTVEADTPKLLCLSIPYDQGWSATIDGQDAALYRANNMFLALPVEAGAHRITLNYFPQGLKLGLLISIITFLAIVIWRCIVFQKGKRIV